MEPGNKNIERYKIYMIEIKTLKSYVECVQDL